MIRVQVGESRPKKTKPVSEAIKWVEDIDHSHTFLSWKDIDGRRWVAEAKGSGVRLLSNLRFKQESYVVNVYDYICTEESFNDLIDFIWLNSANKYGFKQIYGLLEMRLVNKVCRFLGLNYRHKNRFTDGDYSQICCEFVVKAAQVAIGLFESLDKVEQWGLRETRNFNLSHCFMKADKDRIDRINGVI